MYTSKKFEDLTISDDFMFGIVTGDLSEAVESAKRNEKWRRGKYSDSEISEITGLSMEQIPTLKSSME